MEEFDECYFIYSLSTQIPPISLHFKNKKQKMEGRGGVAFNLYGKTVMSNVV